MINGDELELDCRDLSAAAISNGPPWYLRVGRAMDRRKIRGGHRLLSEARRRGLLDKLVMYTLAEGVQLGVPVWRPCNTWDERDVLAYESRFVALLSKAVSRLGPPVTLVDCGADIGTITVHLVAKCRNIAAIVAFEPNPAAHRVLARNLAALPIRAESRHAAVGDFTGMGTLVSPPHDRSAHAMYVDRAAGGEISVQRIDDIGIAAGGSCAIKIDVEGSELSVVAGAAATISGASEIVVAFEAHPAVAQRNGRDPGEVMRALSRLRPDFQFMVDTPTPRMLRPDVPLFEQVPPDRVYNVVATTRSV